MKIVACIKRVPTTEAQARVAADGKSLDESGFQYMTSFYDELAVEQAVRTKEALGGEVIVLTLGAADASKEVRECIAKGADAGVILADKEWGKRDCWVTTQVLAQQIAELAPELVFVGKVATDLDNSAVGPMLATKLGWACVTEVVALEIEGKQGTAKRETEAGVETCSFSLPAVITCNKGLNEPRYAGLKGIMAAKKKPLDEKPAEIPAARVEVVSMQLPPARKEGRILGEGVAAVPALIEALRKEAQVL